MIHLILALLSVSSAHADWEANFTAESSKKSFPKAQGKFYSKGDRFRVDTNVPFDLSLYAKAGSTHLYAAVHSFHIRLSSDLARFSAQVPACLSAAFEDCVKRFSLKKVREEPCGDAGTARTCEVYESGARVPKGIRKIEVRHWKGEAEPILASSVVTKSDGDVIRTAFTKIGRKAHDASFYVVPPSYVNAGSLEKFLGDFKGGRSE